MRGCNICPLTMEEKMFNAYTHQYSLSKTLRFELIPVDAEGARLPDLSRFVKVIADDKQRAKDYQLIKPLIDECHKTLIERTLSICPISAESFTEYAGKYYQHKAMNHSTADEKASKEKVKKELDEIEKKWRADIVKQLESDEAYKTLFGKELFQPSGLLQKNFESEKAVIAKFEKFTTYFTGFFENRKNLYSKEKDSTAIANRLITENLPKFLDNLKKLQSIAEKFPDLDTQIKAIQAVQDYSTANVHPIDTPPAFAQLLTQKGIDAYNHLLGGFFDEGSVKIQGINEIINLYRQQNNLKKNQCPNLVPLFKQILFDRESNSFKFAPLENVADIFSQINTLTQKIFESEAVKERSTLISELSAEQSELGIADKHLNIISAQIFGGSQWSFMARAMGFREDDLIDEESSKPKKKLQVKRDSKAVYSLSHLAERIKQYEFDGGTDDFNQTRADWISLLGKQISATLALAQNALETFNQKYPTQTTAQITQERLTELQKEDIKTLMDALLSMVQAFKSISIADESAEAHTGLLWQEQTNSLGEIIGLYNRIRNFATQKPYDLSKIKINFNNATLLNGWDVNKETDNTSVILQKGGQYFLGILADNRIFDYQLDIDELLAPSIKSAMKKANLREKIMAQSDDDYFEKVVYKLLPGVNKMLPKVFFSKSRQGYFNPSEEVLRIREQETFKKGDNFSIDDCHTLIDFYKNAINAHPEWCQFGFQFTKTKDYQDISQFYNEVQTQGYSIKFDRIKSSYINECVAKGKLHLFQIYNKDFSKFSKGTPNLHTLYWRALFAPENLNNVVVKLNGEAEMFYREKSLEAKITHPKNQAVKNKNALNPKTESQFEYDLIKDKRFTMDKMFFHVPLTLNFKNGDVNAYQFNQQVNQTLQTSIPEQTHIIGIDRGERHLLYYSVINAQTGKIVEQASLNTITNEQTVTTDGEVVHMTTDYHGKLDKVEKDRDEKRKNWGEIQGIKELKEGYLSHVVHKIATLMVKYNAFVVLEDLNFGFKRGRFHVEKQVYQKFEKALIDKLNYLVFKKTSTPELGGVLNAYQLTAPFTAFKDLGKQTGFLYYVPAHHTSKIDPWTGYVDWIRPRYESVEKSKSLIACFDRISYNATKDQFEFKMNVNKFREHGNIPNDLKRTEWLLCTHGEERWRASRDKSTQQWTYKSINITEEFKALLLEVFGADFGAGENLIDRIIERSDKAFYSSFLWMLGVLMSLRFTRKDANGEEIDYILSPVANVQGEFFDSRRFAEQHSPITPATYPIDADANGAYHIAKKGQMLYQNIKSCSDIAKAREQLLIKNVDWFNFIQNQ